MPSHASEPASAPRPEFDAESLFLELRDERTRNRRREAVFLSVIVHLCLLIFFLLAPSLSWLHARRVVLLSPQQAIQNQRITYLETPVNPPKVKQKVHSNVLSDRDRLFHRHQRVLESYAAPASPPPRAALHAPVPARPASPPPTATVAANQAQPAPKAAVKSEAKGPETAKNGLRLENVPPPQTAQLRVPIPGMSAADQLRRAIQAAAQQRAQGSQGLEELGQLPRPGGAPGIPGPGGRGQMGNGLQILTDTEGVDFKPYLQRVLDAVRANWYAVMPEMAYLGRKGRVIIVFRIERNGSVPGLLLESGSGTLSFDQAASAAIHASNPFPPLPSQFHGPEIVLRFGFFYNIDPNQIAFGQ